jgi:hypothetical protein
MEDLKINYLITADQVISDESTGKISAIGIFDKINASGVPALHSKFSLIVNLLGSANKEYDACDIEILDETTQKPIAAGKQEKIKFTNSDKLNLIIDLSNVVFTYFGNYPVKITVGEKTLTTKDHYVSVEKK